MSANRRGFVGRETRGESEQLLYRTEREKKKNNRKSVCLCAVCAVSVALAIAVLVGVVVGFGVVASRLPDDPYERAVALLESYPLIDGYGCHM